MTKDYGAFKNCRFNKISRNKMFIGPFSCFNIKYSKSFSIYFVKVLIHLFSPYFCEIIKLCNFKIETFERMKIISTKKQERLEKKKKKMAALVEMQELNDKDRNHPKLVSNLSDASDKESSTSSTEKTDKFQLRNSSVTVEPKHKKLKLEDVGEIISRDQMQVEQTTSSLIQDEVNTQQSTEEEYLNLKRIVSKRKHVPTFRLKEVGESASLSVDHENRTPIFLTDIQHLLMGAIIGKETACLPSRWCTVDKISKLSHTVVFIIEGISLFHYLSYENNFSETNKLFQTKLEVVLPTFQEGKILQELAVVPLTAAQKSSLIKQYGSLETAIEMNKDPTLMVREMFPIENNNSEEEITIPIDENKNDDSFPRTKLLLSALQMVDEGYPLPLRGELAKRYKDYKFTKDTYEKVTDKSPLFSVDCEMCRTSLGVNELTRISIVNEDFQTVYESLVRPTNRIVDYLTKYSGITPAMMMSVSKLLEDVQKDVKELLPPHAILVGQSLNSDLHAMRMMHPYCIDTSVIFNITGDRRRKTKLQALAKTFLGEDIQTNLDGHDSVEDSIASMKLTKLKLLKGLDYGDSILMSKKQQNEKTNLSNNLFACVSNVEKTTAIVTSQEISQELKDELEGHYKINTKDDETHSLLHNSVAYYKMDGNKSAIHKAREIVMENSLTIVNANIAPQQLELSRIEKSIGNIDKWISKLYDCVASNGLFIVMLGGSLGSTSGVAMMKIKKNSNVSETSITV